MNQYIRILLTFQLFILVMNSGISQSLQLSNRTKTILTLLVPLTEAEMSSPLHLADLRQRNILKAPLANGAQFTLNIKRPDQSTPNLLAVSESAPGSFENTFTYFMIYGVKGDNVSLDESHFIGSEELIPPSVAPLPKLKIHNKTAMLLYGLTLHWQEANGKQESILLKPWQTILAGREINLEPEFDLWSPQYTFSLRAKLRKADGTWLEKDLPLQGKTVVIE